MKKKSISAVLNNWKNPFFIRNALIYKLLSLVIRNKKGSYILDDNWDNIIILDACRFDFFENEFKTRNLKGNLSVKISRGAHTIPFLEDNFPKEFYDDIIYITANPHVDLLLKEKFFKLVSSWKLNWDPIQKTVLPETMYDETIETLLKYPDKRLIIHFIQPHYPYIGYKLHDDSLERLKQVTIDRKNIIINRKYRDTLFAIYSTDIYAMIEKNSLIKAYKRNLKLCLDYVEKLINILPGKTVITADHGEALGEKLHPLIPIRFFGHRKGVRIPVLISVPWLTIEERDKNFSREGILQERKKIISKVKDLKSFF